MRTQASRFPEACRNVAGAVLWTVAGAALLAPVGAAVGVYYGAVQALLFDHAPPLGETVLRLTFCSAAVGALLGAFLRLTDGVNPFTQREPDDAAPATALPPVRPVPEVPPARNAHRRGSAEPARGSGGWQKPSLN